MQNPQQSFESPQQPFQSPEEEIAYLRGQLKQYENPSLREPQKDEVEGARLTEQLKTYGQSEPEKTLDPSMQIPQEAEEAIVLDLAPEEHDSVMEELLGHLQTDGVLNTMNIVGKMNNPHITDDFHRLLVEYVRKGYLPEKEMEKSDMAREAVYRLFQIAVPFPKEEKEKGLKELISGMEQFYTGMLSVASSKDLKDNHVTFEIANAHQSNEFVFYTSVPGNMADLLEKQLTSVFPNAQITEEHNDYNIFDPAGMSVGSVAHLSKKSIFPLKSYEEFEQDPASIILNVFSKLQKDGEGASIQLVFKPGGEAHLKAYNDAIAELRKGTSTKEALDYQVSTFGKVTQGLGKGIREVAKDLSAKKKDDVVKDKVVDQALVEVLKNKVSSSIVKANLRIVASAKDGARAEQILHEIESAFNQFSNPQGNSLEFKRIRQSHLRKFMTDFSFRVYDKGNMIPLSIKEITTLMHMPVQLGAVEGQLKQSKASTSPAPSNTPTAGIRLGINKHRGNEQEIYITPEDRLRHMYVIGQTGTGKTTMLRNMIIQDIEAGNGVCFIDPHGSDVESILEHIPQNRAEDVIYFDPSHTERPMGLNMLEYDTNFPEQKTFVVNEMLSIFNKLFDMKTAGGPMFEQYFRNATMLVIEDPDSGNTLLEISRVLSDKAFREMKLSRCKNPLVVQFWKEIAEKAGGEGALQNIVPYVTSKFDIFLSNEIMRPIVSQEQSSIDFREIMDSKKILLVNLAKGRLGDINSSLLGLIIVGKILMSALSRVDSANDLPPFYLYIDEFQNVTTDSISTILSEARKYKLSLTVAHQFIAQLEEGIRDSVFGNVGSIVSYRVGAEDAEFLEKQFEPTFTAHDLMNIDNLNAYVKMLANGEPIKPFSMFVPFPPEGRKDIVDPIKQLSYIKYGRNREEVENLIMKKYSR